MRRAFRNRRVIVVSIIVCGAVLLVGGTWAVATAFRSPDQVAADSEPPPPSLIVSPVIEGTLGHDITVSGVIAHSSQVEVLIGKSGAVLTRSPLGQSDQITAGDLVAEINGEPIFIFSGDFPLYRDLNIGDTGLDVELIQRSLADSGSDIAVDGTLGSRTASEITHLYTRNDYAPPKNGLSPATDPPAGNAEEAESPSLSVTPPVVSSEPQLVLPMANAVVTPELPATVITVPSVGRISDTGTNLTLGAGGLQMTARVSAGTGLGLKKGMTCTVTGGGFTNIDALIFSVGEEPADDGTVELVIRPVNELQGAKLGEEVVATVTVDEGGKTALIVPTRAVIIRGDDAFVRKAMDDGTVVEVRITEVGDSLGRSAVISLDSGALTPGDNVVVK